MATKKSPAAAKPTAPTAPTGPTENVTPEPSKRKKLVVNDAFVDKFIGVLSKGKVSEADLAAELGLDSPKQLSNSLKLKAVLKSGNVNLLDNLVESGRKRRKMKAERPIVFSPKRGIVIPVKKLSVKEIAADQKYDLKLHRNGAITLTPVKPVE